MYKEKNSFYTVCKCMCKDAQAKFTCSSMIHAALYADHQKDLWRVYKILGSVVCMVLTVESALCGLRLASRNTTHMLTGERQREEESQFVSGCWATIHGDGGGWKKPP